MVTFEGDVVDCLKAAVREGKAGNVQAIKIVLEHSGKLVSGTQTLSPFEQWFMSKVEGIDKQDTVADAEIIDEFPELPPRTADNSPEKAKKELNELHSAMNKAKSKKKWNQGRREQYKWQKRAEAIGIDPLPVKRPTPGQKKKWKESIIEAEKLASEHPQEQADSNKIPYTQKIQKQVSQEPPK